MEYQYGPQQGGWTGYGNQGTGELGVPYLSSLCVACDTIEADEFEVEELGNEENTVGEMKKNPNQYRGVWEVLAEDDIVIEEEADTSDSEDEIEVEENDLQQEIVEMDKMMKMLEEESNDIENLRKKLEEIEELEMSDWKQVQHKKKKLQGADYADDNSINI